MTVDHDPFREKESNSPSTEAKVVYLPCPLITREAVKKYFFLEYFLNRCPHPPGIFRDKNVNFGPLLRKYS